MDLMELHRMHARHLYALRRSENTVRFYYYGIQELARHLEAQGTSPVTENVTRATILELQAALRERGISPGGEHGTLRAVRATFRWALGEELISTDPTKRISMPRLPKDPPPTAQPEEIRAALKAAATMEMPLRNKAILLVMLDCGLRLNEVIQLRVGDVDQKRGMVTVRGEVAKGGKPRVVPIGIRAARAVAAYERRERKPAFEHVEELFVSRIGAPLTHGAVHHLFVTLAKEIGVPRSHLSPHAWRRAFAVGMLRGGVNLFELQRMMGHSTLEMTRRYTQLLPDDLQRAHLRASPADHL